MSEIARVYDLFFAPGEVTEIRAFGLSRQNKAWEGFATDTVYGYFNNAGDFATAAEALDAAGATGIYFVLNPVKPDLLARAANRLVAAKRRPYTTSDKDILAIRWLPIDLDPERAAGISSSKDELSRARKLGEKIFAWFKKEYGAVGIRGMSGNGIHLVYRLPDLAPTEDNVELVRSSLIGLQHTFGTEGIKIDTAVFNPARIWKLYGTTAKKGDHTDDRPHRKSYLSKNTRKEELTTNDFLATLATLTPKEEISPKKATGTIGQGKKSRNTANGAAGSLGPLNMRAYLDHYGVPYNEKRSRKGDATLYRLNQCLFDPAHVKDAAIVQDDQGAIYYQCFHDSCKGRSWQMARQEISGSESLARFCEGYDPNWKPPKKKKTIVDAPDPDGESYISYSAKGRIIINHARLANKMEKDFTPIFHEGIHTSDLFYRYQNGVWSIFPEDLILHNLRKELGDIARANTIAEVLKLLKHQTYKEPSQVETDPMILNLQNGMLDSRTLKMKPHAPEYYSRTQLPVKYTKNAKCDLWIKSLMEIFADDLEKINVLQQFFGYCLYPKILFPCALMQIGGGGNGKGTVEHILCSMLGKNNVCHISLSRMQANFGPVELKDKLLNSCGETESGRLDVTNFKNIATGDEVQAEVKYKDDVKFIPIAKHLISMNDFPIIKERTHAFFRRIIVLEYNQKFGKGDKEDNIFLRDQLTEELDGIFLWALEGLEYVLENKGIEVPASVKESQNRFKERVNPLLLFVEECCSLDSDRRTLPQELFDAYVKWADNARLKALGKINFYEQIRLNYGQVRKRRASYETKEYFYGIGINE